MRPRWKSATRIGQHACMTWWGLPTPISARLAETQLEALPEVGVDADCVDRQLADGVGMVEARILRSEGRHWDRDKLSVSAITARHAVQHAEGEAAGQDEILTAQLAALVPRRFDRCNPFLDRAGVRAIPLAERLAPRDTAWPRLRGPA